MPDIFGTMPRVDITANERKICPFVHIFEQDEVADVPSGSTLGLWGEEIPPALCLPRATRESWSSVSDVCRVCQKNSTSPTKCEAPPQPLIRSPRPPPPPLRPHASESWSSLPDVCLVVRQKNSTSPTKCEAPPLPPPPPPPLPPPSSGCPGHHFLCLCPICVTWHEKTMFNLVGIVEDLEEEVVEDIRVRVIL